VTLSITDGITARPFLASMVSKNLKKKIESVEHMGFIVAKKLFFFLAKSMVAFTNYGPKRFVNCG
jgi:hypothetical protein